MMLEGCGFAVMDLEGVKHRTDVEGAGTGKKALDRVLSQIIELIDQSMRNYGVECGAVIHTRD